MPDRLNSALKSLVSLTLTALLRAATLVWRHAISPWSRTACAHRIRHGGDSCSAAFLGWIADHGYAGAIRRLRQRAGDCASAAGDLQSQGHRKTGDADIIIPCVPFIKETRTRR